MGLPKSLIAQGDPYQAQIEAGAAAIVAKMNRPGLDWKVTYQSRVGPAEWIGPYTDEEIKKAGAEQKGLVVLPIAFVSEHSETLVELDMEYFHLAKQPEPPPMCGCRPWALIPPSLRDWLDWSPRLWLPNPSLAPNRVAGFALPVIANVPTGGLIHERLLPLVQGGACHRGDFLDGWFALLPAAVRLSRRRRSGVRAIQAVQADGAAFAACHHHPRRRGGLGVWV